MNGVPTLKTALTEWYPPDVKPIRPGVYEATINKPHNKFRWYAKWTGYAWSEGVSTIKEAAKEDTISSFQNKHWRGLVSPTSKTGASSP